MRCLASLVLKGIVCMGVEEKVMRVRDSGSQSSLTEYIRKQLRQMLGFRKTLGTNRL